jgi:hypothetical protein
MLLHKTGKAREALQAGPAAGLNLADRRILILVDGRRSLDQLLSMLGTEVLPSIDRLLREGYLAHGDAGAADTRAPGLGSAFTGLLRATADMVQARAEQIRAEQGRAGQVAAATAAPMRSATALPGVPPPTSSPAPETRAESAPVRPAHPSGTRRSLAACKMYMLDMLQLQRSPEAAELRAAIQCAGDPGPLVDALLQALRLIVSASSASYGERVTQRLAEILPPDALPRLEAMRAGPRPPQAPSLSIVA